jgi:hypothetical protein
MGYVVKTLVNGKWHIVETIRDVECGGRIAAYRAANNLRNATNDHPNVQKTTITRI